MRNSEPVKQVEIDCKIIRSTEKAYLVDFGAKEHVWVPRSQITDESEDEDGISSIFIPEWLAIEKGMV